MKIYSNRLTEDDVRTAFAEARLDGADVHIDGSLRSWKGRRYAHVIEVFAESITGTRATGHVPARACGPRNSYPRAASWDDWGFVIARLFNIDPLARVGFYDSEADFVAKVRKYPRKGSDLAFLRVLANIKEYDT